MRCPGKRCQRNLTWLSYFMQGKQGDKSFSQLRHINKSRGDPQKLSRQLSEGLLMWDFSLEAIDDQLQAASCMDSSPDSTSCEKGMKWH